MQIFCQKCCFTSTETAGLLGMEAQDHFNFHTQLPSSEVFLLFTYTLNPNATMIPTGVRVPVQIKFEQRFAHSYGSDNSWVDYVDHFEGYSVVLATLIALAGQQP